jgi:hypothetical protein
MGIATRFQAGQRGSVISRRTAVAAIAVSATCAAGCSSSSTPQSVTYEYPPLVPPVEVVVPAPDGGDASVSDAETGLDGQAADASLDDDAGDTGADAIAGDASGHDFDAAADAPVDSDE